MDEITLFIGLVSIFVPIGAAGIGFSWRSARRTGALKQKVNDLEANYAQHIKDDADFQKTISGQLLNVGLRLEKVDVNVATTQTDVAWIKDAIKNGRSKH